MNQLKESISYLDGPFVHFPVLVDVKYLMLLCCRWNRRREKFGLFHIVCKTVQLRAFFERRDQLVSGEQTTQFRCNLQKKTDKKKLFKQLYLKNVCLIILAEIGRHVLLMSSQNRLLSRSGDNSGIVDVYLPGLVIEHSCSFSLTITDIPKFTQFSFIYLWTERLVVGIVKLRHERVFLSRSN